MRGGGRLGGLLETLCGPVIFINKFTDQPLGLYPCTLWVFGEVPYRSLKASTRDLIATHEGMVRACYGFFFWESSHPSYSL